MTQTYIPRDSFVSDDMCQWHLNLNLKTLESLQGHFYAFTVTSEKRIITHLGEGAPGFVIFSELQIPGSFRGQGQNPPFNATNFTRVLLQLS